MQQENPLRALPSINELLQDERLVALEAEHGHELALEAARRAIEAARERVSAGEQPEDIVADALDILEGTAEPRLRRVLNATGVIVHTNLGRAPLAARALERIQEVAGGYSNLEYDLEGGTRGSRHDHIEPLLRDLTGAEAALVVNNNAAAVLLAVAALAEGRDVVVSRGELVEIGDGFRIPEVLARSGARLVEVGTTNRTRLEDYPNVPTITEAGFPDVGTIAWNGMFAPAGTPKPVLEALYASVKKALDSPEAQAKFKKQNYIVAPSKSLDDAQTWLTNEMKHWQTVTTAVKIDVSQ